MAINLSEIHVVEFSLSQKAFHVHTMAEAIEDNVKSLMARKQGDYVIIAIAETYQQADHYCQTFKNKFKLGDFSIYTDTNGNMIVP